MENRTLRIDLQLTPISPVAVGAGERLGAGIDFWVEGDVVRIVKQRVFVQRLQDLDLEDAFSAFVAAAGQDIHLPEFFEANDLDVEALTVSIPNCGLSTEERRELHRVIHSGGRPYLPGSTLKGAVRTAILFHWLETDPEGMVLRKAMVNALLNLEWLAMKLLNSSGRDRKEIRREAKKKLQSVLDEDILFGEIKDNRPYSQFLQFTDSQCLPASTLGAYLYDRVWLKPASQQREDSSPSTAIEAIRHDAQHGAMSLRLMVRPSELKSKPYLFSHAASADSLRAVLNYFAQANVNEEICLLEDAHAMLEMDRQGLLTFYLDLEKGIQAGTHAHLRIGKGKTFYQNTMGLLLLRLMDSHVRAGEDSRADTVDHAWKVWRALAWEVPMDQKIWPKTRTVARLQDGSVLPPGWMQCELVEHSPQTPIS